jgi:hypothetical protein
MDKILSLEDQIKSYKYLTIGLFVAIIGVIILYASNPASFNKIFGYEFFVTGPILLLISFLVIFTIKLKNHEKTYFSEKLFPDYTKEKYPLAVPLLVASIIAIGIGGFILMLYVAGIFSNLPPENNTAALINCLFIIIMIGVFVLVYFRSKKTDEPILKSLPTDVQKVFELRTKYTIGFVLFCLGIMLLYFLNPWNIMTKYGGPAIFFSLFVGFVFIIMIYVYQYYFLNPSEASTFDTGPKFLQLLKKGAYILGAIILSGLLIYGALNLMGILNQDGSKAGSWGNLFFNVILFCTMLGIVYRIANAGGFLTKNPYYRLIVNTLFYIPCLLLLLFYEIGKILGFVKGAPGSLPPDPFELKLLIISFLLLGGYFFWFFFLKPYLQKKYLQQGGKQLINQPVPTGVLTNVASYQQLNESDKFNYQYAISFWVYLDSFPPSTSSAYTKIVPILSYGENPTIKYMANDNCIYITVKQNSGDNYLVEDIQKAEMDITPEAIEKWQSIQDDIKGKIEQVKSMPFGNDVDADGHRIIYKHSNVLLQKWNHIVLNYNGGTLDVFYNGKLVKSAIEVVPYMRYDMLSVGEQNGVSGNIANLMYFKQPIDIVTVHTLYNSLKDKNPPSIPENNKTLIPLPNNI